MDQFELPQDITALGDDELAELLDGAVAAFDAKSHDLPRLHRHDRLHHGLRTRRVTPYTPVEVVECGERPPSLRKQVWNTVPVAADPADPAGSTFRRPRQSGTRAVAFVIEPDAQGLAAGGCPSWTSQTFFKDSSGRVSIRPRPVRRVDERKGTGTDPAPATRLERTTGDMQKITTYLWFDNQAEEAAEFYTSIFADSRILDVQRYPEGGPGPAGQAMMVSFELAGQRFLALNGGPQFTFTEAISLYVDCASQEEVDDLWARLTDGGEESQCGWLKDRYGLSWQIVPRALPELMSVPDPAAAQRVMQAMLGMRKIEIKGLEDAAKGVS